MSWAREPVRDAAFELGAGADEGSPETSYVPGAVTNIRLRTKDRLKKFRGVMLTAESVSSGATRTKVGQWEIIDEFPKQFDHPNRGQCPNTLIHASAAIKLAHLRMKWKAPPAGTGSVVFKVLIKVGNANHGEFYYPVADLVLTEGAVPNPQTPGQQLKWVQGAVGQSCDQVCAALPPSSANAWSCKDSAFADTSLSAMKPVFDSDMCVMPYFSTCDSQGLGPSSGNGLCYYHDTAICGAEGRPVVTASCSAASSSPENGRRWCPCADTPPVCTPITACPNPSTQCGNVADGCGGTVGCGGCPLSHQTCVNKVCSCTPHTCVEHGWTCGTHPDGCAGSLNCGTCNAGESCRNNSACVSDTCTPNAMCPTGGNGCGTLLTTCKEDGSALSYNCGTCTLPNVCDPVSNLCGCTPIPETTACSGKCGLASDGCFGTYNCTSCACTKLQCSDFGGQCGSRPDNCGGTVSCGACPSGQMCNTVTNKCATTCTPLLSCPNPTTQCGNIDDGCGGTISCGGCPRMHDTCTNKVCSCKAHTCAEHGWTCGSHADGCGGTINCGACPGGQSCNSGSICVQQGCTPMALCPTDGTGCGTLTTVCNETNALITFDCGTCRAPETCGAGNKCTCTPQPASAVCGSCGVASDGCGRTIDCGACQCAEANTVWQGGACLCDKNNGYKYDGAGNCVSGQNEVSAGSLRWSSSLPLTAGLVVALVSRRATLLVCVVAILAVSSLSGAEAHNWINSPSRSREASTIKPHKQGTMMPHVQVAPGQKFQIEWMAAHTSSDKSYFVTIRADDESILNQLTAADLDDYLANAPSNAQAMASDPVWSKYHRKGRNGANTDNDFYSDTRNVQNPGWFDSVVSPGSTYHLPRPSQFKGWIRDTGVIDEPTGVRLDPAHPPPNEVNQLKYKPANLANDARATYSSSSYPEVISVAAFYHDVGQFIRPDVAQFEIPAGSPKGRYIIWWMWQGYYDSIDVDVVTHVASVPASEMYGVPNPGAPIWTRTDHAQYEEPQWVFGGCMGVVNNIQRCMDNCGTNCDGVNVVPIHPPPGVYSGFLTTPDSRLAWDSSSGQPTGHTNCPRAEFTNAPQGSYLCFPVDARRDIGANTVSELTITDDPEDPVFYSFAWTKHEGLIFDLSNSVQPPAPTQFRFGDDCVTCDQLSQLGTSFYNYPYLSSTKSQQCRNCNLEPSTKTPLTGRQIPAPWTRAADHSTCDGSPDRNDQYAATRNWQTPSHHTCPAGTECVKVLNPGKFFCSADQKSATMSRFSLCI
jgi:hypothetical protein